MRKKFFFIAACLAVMASITPASITQDFDAALSAGETVGGQWGLLDNADILGYLNMGEIAVLKVDSCVGLVGPESAVTEDVLILAENITFEQGDIKVSEIITGNIGLNHGLMLSALPSN